MRRDVRGHRGPVVDERPRVDVAAAAELVHVDLSHDVRRVAVHAVADWPREVLAVLHEVRLRHVGDGRDDRPVDVARSGTVRPHLIRAFRDLVAHGWHRLHVLGDCPRVGVRHVLVPAERHRRAHERAVGSASVADRIDDLVLRPRADAGLHVGRDVLGVRLEDRLLDDECAGEVLRVVGRAVGQTRRVAVAAAGDRFDEIAAVLERVGAVANRCGGGRGRCRRRRCGGRRWRRRAARALLRGRNPRLPKSSSMPPRSRRVGRVPRWPVVTCSSPFDGAGQPASIRKNRQRPEELRAPRGRPTAGGESSGRGRYLRLGRDHGHGRIGPDFSKENHRLTMVY